MDGAGASRGRSKAETSTLVPVGTGSETSSGAATRASMSRLWISASEISVALRLESGLCAAPESTFTVSKNDGCQCASSCCTDALSARRLRRASSELGSEKRACETRALELAPLAESACSAASTAPVRPRTVSGDADSSSSICVSSRTVQDAASRDIRDPSEAFPADDERERIDVALEEMLRFERGDEPSTLSAVVWRSVSSPSLSDRMCGAASR